MNATQLPLRKGERLQPLEVQDAILIMNAIQSLAVSEYAMGKLAHTIFYRQDIKNSLRSTGAKLEKFLTPALDFLYGADSNLAQQHFENTLDMIKAAVHLPAESQQLVLFAMQTAQQPDSEDYQELTDFVKKRIERNNAEKLV